MGSLKYSEEYLNLIIEQQEYDVFILTKIKTYLQKIENRNYILSKEELDEDDKISKTLYFMFKNDILYLQCEDKHFHLTKDFLRYMKGE